MRMVENSPKLVNTRAYGNTIPVHPLRVIATLDEDLARPSHPPDVTPLSSNGKCNAASSALRR